VLARRTVVAVAAIVILCVPFAVFAAISGQGTAASWAALGGAVALTNLMIGGRAIAYLSVGLLTALTPVAIVSGAVPVAGAGLMAIMCFGVGLSAAQGLHRGMLLIPMYLAFMIIAPPPWSGHAVDRTSTSYLLWNMLFLGGGALWAALVFPPLLRKQKMPPRPEPWTRDDTLIYTTTITVLCTASTLGVLIWRPGSNGAWLVLTLLAVTQFGADTHLKRTLGRVAGTVTGVVIAAIVASVSGSEAVLLAIGLVLLVITVVIMLGPHSYVLYSIFITPTVVLFTSTSIADVPATDKQRLVFTLIGSALILLASGITLRWAHYQETHSPAAAAEPQSQTVHARATSPLSP
jgi:Fusaric acid resistance protein-like